MVVAIELGDAFAARLTAAGEIQSFDARGMTNTIGLNGRLLLGIGLCVVVLSAVMLFRSPIMQAGAQ